MYKRTIILFLLAMSVIIISSGLSYCWRWEEIIDNILTKKINSSQRNLTKLKEDIAEKISKSHEGRQEELFKQIDDLFEELDKLKLLDKKEDDE